MVLEYLDAKLGLRLASGKMDMEGIDEFPIRVSSEVQFLFLWEKLIFGRWK